ncbi:MAG: hypothetical protein ABII07_04800 [Patescibacteria group bacterium]|nr:hypothetical protein [Patescibacteria group bacterium]
MEDKKKLFPNLKKKEEDGNVFTDLFEKGKDSEVKDDVVDSVVKKSERKGPILGPKPKTGDVQVSDKPFRLGLGLIKLSVFLWVLFFAASYLTMGASFDFLGLNIGSASEAYFEDIKDVQAELNADNYLISYYYLDSFAYLADSYLYKHAQYDSNYTSSAEKAELEDDIFELESDLSLALTMAQNRLSQSVTPEGVEVHTTFSPEIEFKAATEDFLEEKIASLSEKSADPDILLEIRGLNGALALLQNGVFVKNILATQTSEELSHDTVSELVADFSRITTDDFTLISQIKNNRQNWSEIIMEIENITKDVDPLYGTSVESDLNYSSYSIDSDSNTISLQGSTSTDDTRNFTLIANLIDALEQSDMFSNVVERSFSKTEKSSKSDSSYEASFRLSFGIQDGEDLRDTVFILYENKDESTPVSRTE